MQDKNTTESTFFQLLGPILSQDLWQKISNKVAFIDKYAKKLRTVQLVQLVMNAEMQHFGSLDEISNSLNEDEFAKAIHLDSISTSQISRRFRDMSTDVADIIHKSVVHKLGLEVGFKALRQSLGRLYLIDASTISLCLSQYLWADFRKTKGGVKLHQRIRFDGDPSTGKEISALKSVVRVKNISHKLQKISNRPGAKGKITPALSSSGISFKIIQRSKTIPKYCHCISRFFRKIHRVSGVQTLHGSMTL